MVFCKMLHRVLYFIFNLTNIVCKSISLHLHKTSYMPKITSELLFKSYSEKLGFNCLVYQDVKSFLKKGIA